MRQAQRQVFEVSDDSGSYADQVLYLKMIDRDSPKGSLDFVKELTVDVEDLASGAEIEIDLLRAGGDPRESGDWNTARVTYDSTGLKDPIFLSEWYGVRIRAVSGGTEGDCIINVAWVA